MEQRLSASVSKKLIEHRAPLEIARLTLKNIDGLTRPQIRQLSGFGIGFLDKVERWKDGKWMPNLPEEKQDLADWLQARTQRSADQSEHRRRLRILLWMHDILLASRELDGQAELVRRFIREQYRLNLEAVVIGEARDREPFVEKSLIAG